jgi:hypothetical protein
VTRPAPLTLTLGLFFPQSEQQTISPRSIWAADASLLRGDFPSARREQLPPSQDPIIGAVQADWRRKRAASSPSKDVDGKLANPAKVTALTPDSFETSITGAAPGRDRMQYLPSSPPAPN